MFIARHGGNHAIPPHKINYRANLSALEQMDITSIIAVCAVGGIRKDMPPGVVIVPDQIIDYTWGREHTLFGNDLNAVTHIDFTEPYCQELRNALIGGARKVGIEVVTSGTYGATQGPRLETAAEINRMEHDGCDLVGMTGMPEAAIAQELGLCYAVLAVSANYAAGRGDGPIEMQAIKESLKEGIGKVSAILQQVIPAVTEG